jgi:hypothetical protein
MSTIGSKVIFDIIEREKKGKETYGVTMDRQDLSQAEWLQHLYEELLDACLYIKKLQQNETQRRTNHQEKNIGNVESTNTDREVRDIRANVRQVQKAKQRRSTKGHDRIL